MWYSINLERFNVLKRLLYCLMVQIIVKILHRLRKGTEIIISCYTYVLTLQNVYNRKGDSIKFERGENCMTIGNINGHAVYMVTRKEVNYTPSEFMQAYDTWEEGTQKSQLAEGELNALREKYDSNELSDKETIQLFGDLVKAGILSKGNALNIYNGVIPLDVSTYDGTSQGTLSESNATDAVPGHRFGSISGERGYSDFVSDFQNIKELSNSKSESSSYFDAYDGFLQIMEQLRRNTIVNVN